MDDVGFPHKSPERKFVAFLASLVEVKRRVDVRAAMGAEANRSHIHRGAGRLFPGKLVVEFGVTGPNRDPRVERQADVDDLSKRSGIGGHAADYNAWSSLPVGAITSDLSWKSRPAKSGGISRACSV